MAIHLPASTSRQSRYVWLVVTLALVLAVLSTAGLGYMSLDVRIFPFITKIAITALFIYYARDTKYFRPLLMLCLLLAFMWIFSGTGLRYGRLNSLVMAAVMGTDHIETLEYIKTIPHMYPMLALVFGALSLFLLFGPGRKPLHFSAVRAVLLTLLLCFSSFGAFTARAVEEYRSFMSEKALMTAALTHEPDWQIESVEPRHRIYVVLIGESVSKDYMSLYGYPLQTTPFADTAPINYITNYVAPAPYTYPSLARMFSLNVNGQPDPVNHVVTLANAAGFETYWLSNQGYLGETDTRVSNMANRSRHIFFLKKGSYNSINIDDYDLFPHIREALEDPVEQPKVIFVHIMGSHQMACERLFDFPRHFAVGKGENFDCYLSTIEKADTFLRDMVTMLSQRGDDYSLIYFSDHGLIIEPSTKLLTAAGGVDIHHGNDNQQNFSIPFLWLDSGQAERHRIDATVSGFDFIHLYANWLGIKEARLRTDASLESLPETADPLVFDGERLRHYNELPRLPVQ